MYRAAAGQSPTQGSARRAMARSDAGSASAPRHRGTTARRHWPFADSLYFTCAAYLLAISPIFCIISPHICSWSFSFPGGSCGIMPPPIIGQPLIMPCMLCIPCMPCIPCAAGLSAARLHALMLIATAAIIADTTLSFMLRSFGRTSLLSSSWPLRVTGHLGPRIEHVARSPVALDERQDSPDFIVGELTAETRHVALVIRRRVGRHEPALRDAEEHAVRVVPGVAAFIVRRRREAAARQAHAPVRLPFQLRAVADRAVLRIDFPAGADFLHVARVRARIVPRRAHIAAAGEQSERNRPEPKSDEDGSDFPWSNRRNAAKGDITMMDGMGSMMAWMMGLGLLGWVLIVALLVAILVVLVRLLTGRKN